jgi:RHS repeat-associated protein
VSGSSWRRSVVAAAALTSLLAAPGLADAQFKDRLVQAPTLAAPERGSVTGTLSGLAFSPSELSRGGFRLPLPVTLPGERGPELAPVVPAYSPDGGLSEWGMGWGAELQIRRHRILGDLDYATDDFLSPWGILRAGTDGYYYPAGLASPVRLERSGPDWLAVSSDGTRYTFRASAGVVSERGTYAWALVEVESVLGDRTSLEWSKNASGRPRLDRVTWGGRGALRQYELLVAYEPVPTPFGEHTSGKELRLDQRVRELRVSARAGGTGTFALRWRYELGYENAPFGPAFYLARVRRVFASGAAEPAMTFSYELDATRLPGAPLERYQGLDGYLQSAGDEGLQPDRAALQDVDADGRVDLEQASRLTTFRHTDAGWVAEPLPPASGTSDRCRPAPDPDATPRTLARMTADVGEPHVVHTELRADGSSELVVCDRPGRPLLDRVLPDEDWQLGDNVRLVDVDRDRRPDLVRVSREGVDVLHNDSDASGIRFSARPRFAWSLDFDPEVTWWDDFDGDGLVDIVLRTPAQLIVHYGLGGLRWSSTGRPMAIRGEGGDLGDLSQYQVSFVDANKDGLTDLLLSQDTSTWLFTNRGDRFVEVPVAGFRAVTASSGVPVVADLTGHGNVEVAYVADGSSYVVDLATPATGLLASADDGMGTIARFAYQRSQPTSGLVQRVALLTELTVDSSGEGEVTYDYEYERPVAHSVGRFLLGFATTRRSSPELTEEVEFHHDDDVSGLVTASRSVDARSPVYQFTATSYEEASWAGVRFLRPRRAVSGLRNLDGTGELSSAVENLAWERGLCATMTRSESAHGTLTTETLLDDVPALAGLPHCTPRIVRLSGRHARPELDFTYESELVHDASGLLTQARQLGGSAPVVLQDVAYDARHRVARVTQPGQGSATLHWSDATDLLVDVVDTDGVTGTARARDPVSDGLREIATDRGGAPWLRSFSFDGYERLWRAWDDVGAATGANAPELELSYAYAREDGPAVVRLQQMIAQGKRRDSVDLSTASGETVATLTRSSAGWLVRGLVQSDRNQLETRRFWRAPLAEESSPGSIDWTTLYQGSASLGLVRTSGFGAALLSESTLQDGVVRSVSASDRVEGGTLVTTTVENGDLVTDVGVDAEGQTLWTRDENGAETRFDYDALGRLVDVELADGVHQRLRFDAFGRPAEVSREGLTSVRYTYDAANGWMVRKEVAGADGAVERIVEWQRDAIGRVVKELHTQPRTGATSSFAMRYDGQLTGAPGPVPGQRGLLSQVNGDGFERRMLYAKNGAPVRSTLTLAGFRTVEESWNHFEDGTLADDTWVVRDASGHELFRLGEENVYDATGRLAEVRIDGAPFASLVYDGEGRVARVDLAQGGGLVNHFDPVTHGRNGYWIDAETWNAGVDWRLDRRGNVAAETVAFGDQSWLREHEYDARGYLARSHDRDGEARFDYGVSGLLSRVTDLAGDRPITRSPGAVDAGSERYQLDALGRVVKHGALELRYGPTGELVSARRGAREWRYLYDEHSQRLAKLEAGNVVAAFVGGAYLDAERLILPVKINGQLVGVWTVSCDQRRFELLATDPRGTLLGENGVANLPTAYGVRARRPELAAALDYVEHGYDADLGTVRFGARDYDPRLGQFWTPDPAFLESVEACAASPDECNLYGYAGGNPLRFIDPSGYGFLSWAGDVIGGTYDGAIALGEGTYNMVRHPVRTAEGIGSAIRHPLRTAEAVGTAAYDKVASCVGGSGAACGRILFEVATVVVPGGQAAELAEVGKVGKVAEGLADAEKLGEASNVAHKVEGAADVAKLADETGGASRLTSEVGESSSAAQSGLSEAPTDLHAFGSREAPRAPREGIDYHVGEDGLIHPTDPPTGASTFGDPYATAKPTGHYHKIPKGREMPEGLQVHPDGVEVGGTHGRTHHTIGVTRPMAPAEFVKKFLELGWTWAGKKK